MLTNQKVLEVFKDYLSQDPEYEVVLTSHGYTVMYWNIKGEEWLEAEYCKTPPGSAECPSDLLWKLFGGLNNAFQT